MLTNHLVERLNSIWVDGAAVGSDHKPVWAEFSI